MVHSNDIATLVISPARTAQIAAANAWVLAENELRTATAMTRLDLLDALAPDLLPADLFDFAVDVIWHDYITDHKCTDEELTAGEIGRQVQVFARLTIHVPSTELASMAQEAWGAMGLFDVPLIDSDGSIAGYFARFPQARSIKVNRMNDSGDSGVTTVYRAGQPDQSTAWVRGGLSAARYAELDLLMGQAS